MVPVIIVSILAVIIVTVAIIAYKAAMRQNAEIQQNGICVDSVVVSNTRKDDYYRTVVRFTGDDGQEHDCALSYRGGMPIGRKVRIQYIPGKYNNVLFVSQEVESDSQDGKSAWIRVE